jgi:dihydrofolate reductase
VVEEYEKYRNICENISDERKASPPDMWIIGGAEIFNEFLQKKLIQQAFITQVPEDYKADKFIDRKLLQDFRKETLSESAGFSFFLFSKA